MRRIYKQFLNNLTILVSSVILSVTAITISGSLNTKTVDDSALIYKILTGEKTQVKGAFSQNNFCPKNKQVIGWIDFQGNKKIVQSLPDDIQPSSCFKSVQEAQDNGYVDQD